MGMSNLSQYRLSIVFFSLGLLWVVSEVVGDGDQPGMLDKATKSVAHRLNNAGDKTSEPDNGPLLAVSQTYPGESHRNPFRLTPAEGIAAEGADASSAVEGSESSRALPPPDPGMIHK
jgi:hypothetical protein